MLATLRRAWLTKGTYVTSNQESLSNTPSAISSQASVSGAMHSAEQDGQTIDRSGQEAALASLSAQQACEMGLLTSGTSGPAGTGSLSSAALQWSLESRLLQLASGSILYSVTLKRRVMPSQRAIFQLQASQALTGASGFTLQLWATPTTRDHKSEVASEEFNQKRWSETRGKPLSAESLMAGWPTPGAKDGGKSVRTPEGAEAESLRKGWMNELAVAVHCVGWPTPRAADSGRTVWNQSKGGGNVQLDRMTALYLLENPQPARLCSDGHLLTGSSAEMESGGRLNPAHSRWLMRLPPEWDDCAPTEMRSTPKPRQHGALQSRRSARDGTIRLLVEANPRKVETHGHRSFEVAREHPTLKDYLANGGRMCDLNWDIDHGWAELIESESDEN